MYQWIWYGRSTLPWVIAAVAQLEGGGWVITPIWQFSLWANAVTFQWELCKRAACVTGVAQLCSNPVKQGRSSGLTGNSVGNSVGVKQCMLWYTLPVPWRRGFHQNHCLLQPRDVTVSWASLYAANLINLMKCLLPPALWMGHKNILLPEILHRTGLICESLLY